MEVSRNRKWHFTAYGTSVELEGNGFEGSVETGDLSIWSLKGKGKLVPASTDGVAFYYTVLDGEKENFTLSADIEVEEWTFSNGQDGFGLMAADAVGENGDEASFWNNSYMAAVTRVEYEAEVGCDAGKDLAVGTAGHYVMRLGIGAQEKKGVTPRTNLEGTQPLHFRSTMKTLEYHAARQGRKPGTYNIVGAYTNVSKHMNDIAALKRFHLAIRRMNDGYLISYTDEEGVTNSRKFYHEENGDALTKLDPKHIYVGFFAARNARIRIRNVGLEVIGPKEDVPAAPRPMEPVRPQYEILSARTANREEYELVTYANADGKLKIALKETGEEIRVVKMESGAKCRVCLTLKEGENHFLVSFSPDVDYCPSEYERLADYRTYKVPFCVTYRIHQKKYIYISPGGRPEGAGTQEDPMDIYTAVRGAAPGQRLLLADGKYLLQRSLVIDRGMDGTPDAPICLMAEEGARPVLDFGGSSQGLIIAGNYWRCKSFDVTNTEPFSRGIHLAGSYNQLEQISVYRNGNTGLQIGCYQVWDSREEWPRCNMVINCNAYLNADPGYTDSDGFAAKITVGEGNIFEGCISAYNADDGFDLFAKVEKGATGSVLIHNCLAFKNGYILDGEGREVHVGLGNGFKLGGSSIACGHRLEESIAFANGAKGIDANSSPDAHVRNVLTFDNESSNVALYTTDARDTAFTVRGVVSVRTGGNVPDKLEPRGRQDKTQIYHVSNYYFDGCHTVNAKGRRMEFSHGEVPDVEKVIHGGISRKADGSIGMDILQHFRYNVERCMEREGLHGSDIAESDEEVSGQRQEEPRRSDCGQ